MLEAGGGGAEVEGVAGEGGEAEEGIGVEVVAAGEQAVGGGGEGGGGACFVVGILYNVGKICEVARSERGREKARHF